MGGASDAPDDLAVIRRISHSLNDLAASIHDLNVEKGWHDEPRSCGDFCALIHTEVSEVLEHFREHGYANVKALDFDAKGKPVGIPIELADIIIRVLDYAAHIGAPVGEAVFVKYLYNRTRPHRHGGKHL
jgi:hypothetical protein